MDDGKWFAHLEPALLDANLPTPLYHQIYLVLRERIRSGVIAPDVTLPGEQELAKQFEVSRITVKRALNELALDGLVTRHRGRGTIVMDGPKVPVVKGSFDTLMESLHIMGLETEIELLDVSTTPADAAVAHHLGLEIDDPVQRAVRRRKIEGEPFSHLVTFVPAQIAKRYSAKDLASKPLLSLLERAGSAAYQGEQWITAVAAEPQVAAALGVSASAPLLKIERVMRDAKGSAVELLHAHYRPDRFEYHIKLHRRRAAAGARAAWCEEG